MQTMVKREEASFGPAVVKAAGPTERLRRRYRDIRKMTERFGLNPESWNSRATSSTDATPDALSITPL